MRLISRNEFIDPGTLGKSNMMFLQMREFDITSSYDFQDLSISISSHDGSVWYKTQNSSK